MAKAPCMTAMCKTHFTADCCDQASVYRTLLDVVSGMQYLHGLGLVHGVLPPHPPSFARTFVSCVPACIMLQIYLLLQRRRSRLRPIPCWSSTIIVVMIKLAALATYQIDNRCSSHWPRGPWFAGPEAGQLPPEEYRFRFAGLHRQADRLR